MVNKNQGINPISLLCPFGYRFSVIIDPSLFFNTILFGGWQWSGGGIVASIAFLLFSGFSKDLDCYRQNQFEFSEFWNIGRFSVELFSGQFVLCRTPWMFTGMVIEFCDSNLKYIYAAVVESSQRNWFESSRK